MRATTEAITWQSWSQKWGHWGNWFRRTDVPRNSVRAKRVLKVGESYAAQRYVDNVRSYQDRK
jgi:hypothetical protein